MPHPNLSNKVNAIADNQVMYKDLQVGDMLLIKAQDAITQELGSFTASVAGIIQDGKIPDPIFLIDEGSFAFYGDVLDQPIQLSQPTFALAGVSARLIPQPIFVMMGIGGIGIGRDYSFEYIDGGKRCLYVHNIDEIFVYRDNFGQDFSGITAYLERVEQTKQIIQEKKEARQKVLDGEIEFQTQNSTYHFGSVQSDGTRMLIGNNETPISIGWVFAGRGLCYEIYSGENAGERVETSKIIFSNPPLPEIND